MILSARGRIEAQDWAICRGDVTCYRSPQGRTSSRHRRIMSASRNGRTRARRDVTDDDLSVAHDAPKSGGLGDVVGKLAEGCLRIEAVDFIPGGEAVDRD
jgi:hypothetical protein